jgi:hypothetical protein
MRSLRKLTRPGTAAPAIMPAAEREQLACTAGTLAEIGQEVAGWLPVLRRLAEAEALRELALGRNSEINGAAVRSIIAARRLRDRHFWPLMSEAAWSLMLELFARRLDGDRLDAAGLGAATAIPFDSTLHWIDWLCGRGMVFRNGRGASDEAALIDLTDAGADAMRAYLTAALRLSPWVI